MLKLSRVLPWNISMFQMFQKNKLKTIIFLGIILFVLPGLAKATSVSLGQQKDFFVDPFYDFSKREQITAVLQRIGQKAYFYIDIQWWERLSSQEQEAATDILQDLDIEFFQRIYPELTKTFGSEWNPGIDNDNRIVILFHALKSDAGGYFNSGNEYSKLQYPKSNEKEMLYLNADALASPLLKSFLAHEFVHLITFNQKERIYGAEEEIWLNEARAEYAPTLLGYDDEYDGSNLQERVETFLQEPFDSLTEWQGREWDYGVLNLFTQYLVEQYGIEILRDSLQSKKKGIQALNHALEQNGFEQNFSQVFTDWTITVLVNDCDLGKKYCYQNENLKDLRITPMLNFLPFKGKSFLAVTNTTKNWVGNWFKFINGQGTLRIEFIGHPENLFGVPYIAQDFSGAYELGFFRLDEHQRGEVLFSGFGTDIRSVVIIPSIQNEISMFSNLEPSFSYFWSASIIESQEKKNDFPPYLNKPISEMSQKEILAKIAEIEALLNQLKIRLSGLVGPETSEPEPSIPPQVLPNQISCQIFETNLYYGIKEDNQVICLQKFLQSQGQEIYPEGLITGNFLSLTRQAVIRFQEKYADEILKPWNLSKGTGFVGQTTREKINFLLEQ